MAKLRISELRDIIRDVIEEDVAGFGQKPRAVPPPLPPKRPAPVQQQATPQQAPAAQKPASAALPQKGALNKFKADVNMTADAAARVKAAVDAADTKEALRWLDKVIAFATSAKSNLVK